MRIAIAHISQETNTFSPRLTDMETLSAHGLYRGEEVIRTASENGELAGFLDVVGNEELIGIISARAGPAGSMTTATVQQIVRWFTEDLAKAEQLDGVLLSLHGALAGESEPDVEGLIIEKTRAIVGERTIIGVSLDMHANLTERMVANADVIRGYHTHPHLDMRQTSKAAAEMAYAAMRGEIRPKTRAVKIPMVTPAELQNTEQGPMTKLFSSIHNFEKKKPALSASLFAVQPWLDVPELGWCSLVVTDNDTDLADRFARELAQMSWDQRELYMTSHLTHEEAIDKALKMKERPVVISDMADATTGGATGDSTWFLKALLQRNPADPCYLMMVDPQAVQAMVKAGEGAHISLSLGGKQDAVYSKPVHVTGDATRIFPLTKDRSLPTSMGIVAVLQIGQISVVVSERPGPGHSPVVYTGAGLEPDKAKIIIVKSLVDFRAAYREITQAFILGEAPGLTPSNLKLLNFEKAPRPLFPLDEIKSWDNTKTRSYKSLRG